MEIRIMIEKDMKIGETREISNKFSDLGFESIVNLTNKEIYIQLSYARNIIVFSDIEKVLNEYNIDYKDIIII